MREKETTFLVVKLIVQQNMLFRKEGNSALVASALNLLQDTSCFNECQVKKVEIGGVRSPIKKIILDIFI